MNAKELNVVNQVLIKESSGFDEVGHLTYRNIADKAQIEDLSAISRHLQKLVELGKIEIIKVDGSNNKYKILDPEPISSNYSEPITDKQKGLLRHFSYQFGIDVLRKVCKKIGVTMWIHQMTSEEASNVISFYYKNKNLIDNSAEKWKQTIECFPRNYDITHYADLLDNDIEKTIIVKDELIQTFCSEYSCSPVQKDKTCSHFMIYYFTHFDLIVEGFQHHVYQGKDYYIYNK